MNILYICRRYQFNKKIFCVQSVLIHNKFYMKSRELWNDMPFTKYFEVTKNI